MHRKDVYLPSLHRRFFLLAGGRLQANFIVCIVPDRLKSQTTPPTQVGLNDEAVDPDVLCTVALPSSPGALSGGGFGGPDSVGGSQTICFFNWYHDAHSHTSARCLLVGERGTHVESTANVLTKRLDEETDDATATLETVDATIPKPVPDPGSLQRA